MRNWMKRLIGREGEENSVRTQVELDRIEERVRRYEERVQHLRRERAIYENHRRRGITE